MIDSTTCVLPTSDNPFWYTYFFKQCIYVYTARSILWSLLLLIPFIGGAWIVGLVFMVNGESDILVLVFAIVTALQVSRWVKLRLAFAYSYVYLVLYVNLVVSVLLKSHYL